MKKPKFRIEKKFGNASKRLTVAITRNEMTRRQSGRQQEEKTENQ
jgi:hypothetical protein